MEPAAGEAGGTSPARRAVLGLLILVLPAVQPARADELLPRLEPWPLAVRAGQSVAGRKTSRIAGPLFTAFELEEGVHGWALHPLLAHLRSQEASSFEFLYPLGLLRRGPAGWKLRFTPLLDVGRTHPAPAAATEAKPEGQGWSFLLAFGGRSDAGERYFGVFPLGGVAKQRFGRERLEFWLFPLFARSSDAHGFRRTFLLWPFLSWGSSDGRRLFRFWPFYGHDLSEGHYARRFLLWPFVHWRHERIGAFTERRIRLFLPFYGESLREHARSRFVLGPLFIHSENDRTGEESRTFLWPFLHVASRPPSQEFAGSSEVRIAPLFRRRVAPGMVRTGALLGAIERLVIRNEEDTLRRWRWLWVSRLETARWEGTGEQRVVRHLWPLLRYRNHVAADGAQRGRLAVPWIFPVDGEGWDRHWLAPLTLFERRWTPGQSRSDALWGLWRRRSTESEWAEAAGWLYRREGSPDGSASLRMLGLPVRSAD
jgi:hypothetical protein